MDWKTRSSGPVMLSPMDRQAMQRYDAAVGRGDILAAFTAIAARVQEPFMPDWLMAHKAALIYPQSAILYRAAVQVGCADVAEQVKALWQEVLTEPVLKDLAVLQYGHVTGPTQAAGEINRRTANPMAGSAMPVSDFREAYKRHVQETLKPPAKGLILP